MPIGLFLDSNIWNFLHRRGLDLCAELPPEEFTLAITREGEIELPDQGELRDYINGEIEKCGVKTDAFFGFYNPDVPMDKQRAGGFDFGRFATYEDIANMKKLAEKRPTGSARPNGLYKQEADISLATRAFSSIVLTLDKKPGPLKDAFLDGGKVIFLTDFDATGLTLKGFILQKIAELDACA